MWAGLRCIETGYSLSHFSKSVFATAHHHHTHVDSLVQRRHNTVVVRSGCGDCIYGSSLYSLLPAGSSCTGVFAPIKDLPQDPEYNQACNVFCDHCIAVPHSDKPCSGQSVPNGRQGCGTCMWDQYDYHQPWSVGLSAVFSVDRYQTMVEHHRGLSPRMEHAHQTCDPQRRVGLLGMVVVRVHDHFLWLARKPQS